MMSDKDIIKALECCRDCCCKQCENEPNFQDPLDLIDRLQTENEGLLQKLQQAQAKYETFKAQEEKAHQYCKNVCELKYKAEIDRLESLSERLGDDVDLKLKYIYELEEKLKTAKAEAVKEFAEKFIQEDGYNNHNFDDSASILLHDEYIRGRDEKTKEVWKLIKRIKKEMVGKD